MSGTAQVITDVITKAAPYAKKAYEYSKPVLNEMGLDSVDKVTGKIGEMCGESIFGYIGEKIGGETGKEFCVSFGRKLGSQYGQEFGTRFRENA